MQVFSDAANKAGELAKAAERRLWSFSETGFFEEKTCAYLIEQYEKLGYSTQKAGNIPGFYVDIDTGKKGPTVALFAEMDAVLVPSHPEADKSTGAVHACGHHVQCAALLGVAKALREPKLLQKLCGKIRLINVPAEENIELSKRRELIKKGIIQSTSGKVEILRRGWLENVDMCFMVHIMTGSPSAVIFCRKGGTGSLTKTAHFKGLSAHWGGAPWRGVNAHAAANLAISNINSLRETFREKDMIRIQPMITEVPSSLTSVPEYTELKCILRAASVEALENASMKINRAVSAAALAMGAEVKLSDRLSSLPLINDDGMTEAAFDAACAAAGAENCAFINKIHGAGTDLGAVSCFMPTLLSYIRGAEGLSHGADFRITDPDTACIENVKYQLYTLYALLKNGGERAYGIIKSFKPRFKTADEYFEFIKGFGGSFSGIEYDKNGSATVYTQPKGDK